MARPAGDSVLLIVSFIDVPLRKIIHGLPTGMILHVIGGQLYPVTTVLCLRKVLTETRSSGIEAGQPHEDLALLGDDASPHGVEDEFRRAMHIQLL